MPLVLSHSIIPGGGTASLLPLRSNPYLVYLVCTVRFTLNDYTDIYGSASQTMVIKPYLRAFINCLPHTISSSRSIRPAMPWALGSATWAYAIEINADIDPCLSPISS